MLYDSHAHLNNEGFDPEEREAFIESVAAAVDSGMLSYVNDIGFNLASSVMAVEHARTYPWCYAAVGCHPHDSKDMDELELAMLAGLAQKPKVKAIGEIGLDFYYDHSQRDVQEYWFRRQVQLANELKLPIVIHDRDAHDLVLRVLKEEGAFGVERQSWFPKRPAPDEGGGRELLPDARVLLHCFSGGAELARQYVKLGATISIAGPVTYKNARKLIEVVEETPIEFLLVETDAPYLTPEPFRGRKNRPPYVRYTAEKVAQIKGLPLEEVARITCENAKRFFGVAD